MKDRTTIIQYGTLLYHTIIIVNLSHPREYNLSIKVKWLFPTCQLFEAPPCILLAIPGRGFQGSGEQQDRRLIHCKKEVAL